MRKHLNQNLITVDTIFTHILHTHATHICDFRNKNNFFTASRYFFDYVPMINNTPDNISAHTFTILPPS